MPKDYAKLANKTSQAKKPRRFSWLWPVIVLIVIIAALALWKHHTHVHEKRAPVENAKPAVVLTQASSAESDKPHFEFYTMLPKMQVSSTSDNANSNAFPTAPTIISAQPAASNIAASPSKSQPTAGAPVESPTPTIVNKPYILQLGIFRDKPSAEAYKNNLGDIGTPLHIQTVRTGNGVRYRVQAGPFESKAMAQHWQAKLAKSKVSSIVKKL